MMSTILISGCVWFTGSNIVENLNFNDKIIGNYDVNNYHDINSKNFGLCKLQRYNNFIFKKRDLSEKAFVDSIFYEYRPNMVINLAAQAGIRYSIDNP